MYLVYILNSLHILVFSVYYCAMHELIPLLSSVSLSGNTYHRSVLVDDEEASILLYDVWEQVRTGVRNPDYCDYYNHCYDSRFKNFICHIHIQDMQ